MYVIAVTSCATGIAHTFMAAEAIKKAGKKYGAKVKVETQGAMGIENKLSDKDIASADLIIFANDVKINKVERFKGYEDKIINTTPHDVIGKKGLVEELIENASK